MKNPLKIIMQSLLLLMILKTFSLIAFTQEKPSEKNDAPILDYEVETQKITDKDVLKNGKSNLSHGTFGRVITELPIGVEPLPTINHWWVHLPALPVAESTAIVFGKITNAEAHLSNDRTEIYSKFSVNIEKVFKDTSNAINSDKKLLVSRLGGNIRFASGRINKYTIDRQGMPQIGEDYYFFLKRLENGGFIILTGYKIASQHVTPLDGEDSEDPRSDLPFARYRNVEESNFLQDLRTALKLIKSVNNRKNSRHLALSLNIHFQRQTNKSLEHH